MSIGRATKDCRDILIQAYFNLVFFLAMHAEFSPLDGFIEAYSMGTSNWIVITSCMPSDDRQTMN